MKQLQALVKKLEGCPPELLESALVSLAEAAQEYEAWKKANKPNDLVRFQYQRMQEDLELRRRRGRALIRRAVS